VGVGDQQSQLSSVSSAKALNHLANCATSKGAVGRQNNSTCAIAEIGSGGRGHLLPLAQERSNSYSQRRAEEYDVGYAGQSAYDGVGEAFVSGQFDFVLVDRPSNYHRHVSEPSLVCPESWKRSYVADGDLRGSTPGKIGAVQQNVLGWDRRAG